MRCINLRFTYLLTRRVGSGFPSAEVLAMTSGVPDGNGEMLPSDIPDAPHSGAAYFILTK